MAVGALLTFSLSFALACFACATSFCARPLLLFVEGAAVDSDPVLWLLVGLGRNQWFFSEWAAFAWLA